MMLMLLLLLLLLLFFDVDEASRLLLLLLLHGVLSLQHRCLPCDELLHVCGEVRGRGGSPS